MKGSCWFTLLGVSTGFWVLSLALAWTLPITAVPTDENGPANADKLLDDAPPSANGAETMNVESEVNVDGHFENAALGGTIPSLGGNGSVIEWVQDQNPQNQGDEFDAPLESMIDNFRPIVQNFEDLQDANKIKRPTMPKQLEHPVEMEGGVAPFLVSEPLKQVTDVVGTEHFKEISEDSTVEDDQEDFTVEKQGREEFSADMNENVGEFVGNGEVTGGLAHRFEIGGMQAAPTAGRGEVIDPESSRLVKDVTASFAAEPFPAAPESQVAVGDGEREFVDSSLLEVARKERRNVIDESNEKVKEAKRDDGSIEAYDTLESTVDEAYQERGVAGVSELGPSDLAERDSTFRPASAQPVKVNIRKKTDSKEGAEDAKMATELTGNAASESRRVPTASTISDADVLQYVDMTDSPFENVVPDEKEGATLEEPFFVAGYLNEDGASEYVPIGAGSQVDLDDGLQAWSEVDTAGTTVLPSTGADSADEKREVGVGEGSAGQLQDVVDDIEDITSAAEPRNEVEDAVVEMPWDEDFTGLGAQVPVGGESSLTADADRSYSNGTLPDVREANEDVKEIGKQAGSLAARQDASQSDAAEVLEPELLITDEPSEAFNLGETQGSGVSHADEVATKAQSEANVLDGHARVDHFSENPALKQEFGSSFLAVDGIQKKEAKREISEKVVNELDSGEESIVYDSDPERDARQEDDGTNLNEKADDTDAGSRGATVSICTILSSLLVALITWL